MAQLLFQGHGSYRITTNNGIVIYIDPFAGKGYGLPADLILVTHEHFDHNRISRVTKKTDCRIIRASDALSRGKYCSFEVGNIKIESVEAYNNHHKREDCVGYILTVDQISVYAAGDTSETDQMETLKIRNLDWALLPIDGIFNMDAAEASQCAALIGAKHTIPIHMMPGKLFDRSRAESFNVSGRVILMPGETVTL